MNQRKMQEGLHHKWLSSDDEFLELVDKTGGWPLGFRYAGFEHTDERKAGFTNSPHNDGWWTVVAEADDYYTWKLSAAAMQRILDAAARQILSAASNIRIPSDKFAPPSSRTYGRLKPKAQP